MRRLEIQTLLKELGIHPSKKWGQNFLVDEDIAERIAQSVQPEFAHQKLVEIGPGIGALTQKIQWPQKNLSLIEIDPRLARYWQERAFNVHHQDAMEFDWLQFHDPIQIASNLPYTIASRLIVALSEAPVSRMTLMVQKEVAQRIVSPPSLKSYGLLSVISQVFWKPRILLEAYPKAFWPIPKIASSVVIFQRNPRPVPHAPEFLKFVKCAFNQRRKYLLQQPLLAHWPDDFKQKWPRNLRIESLSPQEILELFEKAHEWS